MEVGIQIPFSKNGGVKPCKMEGYQKNFKINIDIKSKFITNCKYAEKGHLDYKKIISM